MKKLFRETALGVLALSTLVFVTLRGCIPPKDMGYSYSQILKMQTAHKGIKDYVNAPRA